MNRTHLSLGSNLGDRSKNLERAMVLLEERAGHIRAASAVYETEPWGCNSALNFYNQALELLTALEPMQLLETIHKIESLCGREPVAERFAPRIIDIDILFYNDLTLDTPSLAIPHPSLQLRRFVLAPLAEIAPEIIHPVFKKSVLQLLQSCADDKTVKLLLR